MLNDLKLMLGIDAADSSLDSKLTLIVSTVRARLQMLLGDIEPPESMDHIVMEVAIIRFNRIGSEGVSSHSVEGESLQYGENDFAAYMDEINAFLAAQKESARGRLRFL